MKVCDAGSSMEAVLTPIMAVTAAATVPVSLTSITALWMTWLMYTVTGRGEIINDRGDNKNIV